jgi:paraquat-inducible protein B
MSKKANKTVIGAFVLGALALLVIAVLIFGSGQFLKNKQYYELFFQGSVQGLDVGSPVVFRGVKIGSVTNIALEFNPKQLVFDIPVTIEIQPDKAKRLGPPPKKEGELLKPLIDKGLRGQLQTLSLVTGQLAVALDFFPNEPAKFVGTEKKYPEIPTVPSTFAQLTKTIQELPIKDLFAKLDSSVTAINTLVSSKETQASVKSLNRALVEATTVMKNIDARIGPLVASLQNTSDSINTVAVKVSDSMSGERGLPAQIQAALEITRKAVAQAEQTLASVKAMTQENSAMGYELGNALSEMSRSMRSLRVMSDYLERHPEALLIGKRGE